MLTENERRCCFQLLKKLTLEELMSLKNTITRKQICVENREEAVKAIIEYSETAEELLRRKKVRRGVLFQYLADCKVIVSATAEKHVIVRKILEYWGSSISSDVDLRDIDAVTPVTSTTALTERTPSPVPPALSATPSPSQRLGETFVRWFYELLNSENPTLHQDSGGFGPNHFWENCTLKLISRTPDLSEESFEGSVLVSQRLLALVKEELLVFNANISSDGVRVVSDPHGLVIVVACGTIHQHNNCLGIFEQMFGLVSTPINENTWKIKFSQLNLSSSRATAVPKLTESSVRQLLAISGSMALMPRS